MKKFLKSFLAITTALVCAVTLLTPASFQAAVSVPKSQVVYLNSKTGSNYTSIYISGLKQSSKITSVKTDKKSVANPYAVSRSGYGYSWLSGDYNYEDYSANIMVDVFKKGTAKITYKVDGKKKTTTVKAYENPVKSAKITGKASGKSKTIDLTKKTKSQSYADVTNKTKITSPKITIKANTNWKITNVAWSGVDADGQNVRINKSFNNVGSATLKFGTLLAKKYSNIEVSFYNTKTKGTMTVSYRINN